MVSNPYHPKCEWNMVFEYGMIGIEWACNYFDI